MSQQERRKEPRFGVRTGAKVEISINASQELSAVTENMSAHGVLLHLESLIPENQRLKVMVALTLTARTLQLIYEGKVVRTVQDSTTGRSVVAVVCDHPASLS